MAALSTVPTSVDITHLAGDTLSMLITVSDQSFTAGGTWSGCVARTREQAVPDEIFTITPDIAGGATAVLTADQTRDLIDLMPPTNSSTGRKYVGVYDIQVSLPGATRTIVQGQLTLVMDVTK